MSRRSTGDADYNRIISHGVEQPLFLANSRPRPDAFSLEIPHEGFIEVLLFQNRE
jgi:hypothetical protein